MFSNQNCPFWRLVLGAIIASATTLVLFAPEMPFILQLFYQLTATILVIKIAYYHAHGRSFYQICAWYWTFNLLLAGFVTAFILQRETRYHGAHTNNLSIYIYLSPTILIGSVTIIYLGLKLILHCFGTPLQCAPQKIIVLLNGYPLQITAFYDTGFIAQDPFSDRPVILVDFSAVISQLSPTVLILLQQAFAFLNESTELLPFQGDMQIRFLPCKTIAGTNILPALYAEQAYHTDRPQHIQKRLLIAFCQDITFGEGYNALFGANLANEWIRKKE